MNVESYVSTKYIEFPNVQYSYTASVMSSLASDNLRGNITDTQTTSYIDGLFELLSEIYTMPSVYFEGEFFTPETIIQGLDNEPSFFQWGSDNDTAGRNDFTISGVSLSFLNDNILEVDEIATFTLNFIYPFASRSFEILGKTITIKDALPDTDPPAISISSSATLVSVSSNIVLTFSEAIAKGTGSIQLRVGSATGTVFETFDAATSSRLTFLGSTLTIDPSSSLAGGTNYYVTLASGSVKDTAGNSYTGTSAYDFTTVSTSDGGMTSSAANEAFSGDSGTNTLICRNSAANYTLTETDTGWLISSTTDGNDTISNVERLQFTDLNIALDTDAANSAGGIYRLYKAALDRTPDLGGLGYWIAQADAEKKDAVRMATDFTYADEFKTLYGVQTADNYMTGEDITALVTKIYENVLNRAPDAGGRDYYAGQITTHTKTVGQVLAEISDSSENKLAIVDLIAAGIEYTPWVG